LSAFELFKGFCACQFDLWIGDWGKIWLALPNTLLSFLLVEAEQTTSDCGVVC
jgi:hypothetical protein